MANDIKRGLVLAAYTGTIVNVIMISLMTIVAELNKGFKTWLATTFSHHWIGKGIISVIVFIIISLLFTPVLKGKEIKSLTRLTVITVVIIFIGFLAIGGYYFLHYFSE